MREFAASQERRNRIAMVIVILGVVGFAGLKLYQRHLANEASKPIVIETKVPVSNGVVGL